MNKLIVLLLALVFYSTMGQRSVQDCQDMCNDMKAEVVSGMEICMDAKKQLPRPKVGDFCVNAMEAGYSDVCVSMCLGQRPTNRIAQTCRAAAAEMPRPTVRRHCEHGYTTAFTKATNSLSEHFGYNEQEMRDRERVASETKPVANEEVAVEQPEIVPAVPEVPDVPEVPAVPEVSTEASEPAAQIGEKHLRDNSM